MAERRHSVIIDLSESDVHCQSDSEKLTSLVKIAFANHKLLDDHGTILFGNGDPKKGMLFKVEALNLRVGWLIGILSALGIAGLSALSVYLFK
jgi:hypothetical protein